MKKIEDVNVIGIATTRFGERWRSSAEYLAQKAAWAAIAEADQEPDVVYLASMFSKINADALGLDVPTVNFNGSAASGALAVHAAINSLQAGETETVLVVGVEKMTDLGKSEELQAALMVEASEEERLVGLTQPGLHALLTKIHQNNFGTTEDDLAMVAVQNHLHGSLNPKAQYRRHISLEQVRQSAIVADPIKTLDCAPYADGASAILLSTQKKSPVEIVASTVGSDALGLGQRQNLTEFKATRQAANKAYDQAGVDPGDIDIAEVHDNFTIGQILAMEDLGFYKKGEATKAVWDEDGQIVINPSGGLKACGNPVGASGIRQLVELVDQIREGRGRIGLTHNVGGAGVTAVVHILKRSLPD